MNILPRLLLGIIIIPELTLPSLSKPDREDYCSNQGDSYKYRAIYDANLKWKEARDKCRKEHKGCLARPFNRTVLEKIQKSFYLDNVHQPIIYWAGIKYDSKHGKLQLTWDNEQAITCTTEFAEIVNVTEIIEIYDKKCTGRHGHRKCGICLTITNDTQLKPDICDTHEKVVCQIPTDQTPTVIPHTTSATTSGRPSQKPTTTGPPEKKTSTTGPPEKKTSTKGPPEKKTSTKGPPEKKTSTKGPPEKKTSTKGPPEKKTSTKGPPEKKTSTKGPPEKKTSTKGPPEKKTSTKGPPEKKPTRRPKTSTDRKVDDYVNKVKHAKVEDRNSMKSVLNMTSSLLDSLKKEHKQVKGNVMKAAQEMEDFLIKYAKMHLKPNESKMKKGDGFIVEMRNVVDKQRIIFPPKNEHTTDTVGHTSIDLPASLFANKGRIVVSALYEDVKDYIPTSINSNNNKAEIISPVVSSTLVPKPEGVLEDNVTIILKHLKKPSKFKPSCVFWDNTVKNDLNGTWSNRGCMVKDSNENETVCTCNHLTSFALLMQIDENPSTDRRHKMALSYITYIGCGFSLIGETLTVLAYVLLMNMKQEQCQIRVNLAISLAIAQIFYLAGISATSNMGVCTFVAVMLHLFYLAAFGWMMLEGVYLYLMVIKVFNTVIKMKLYYMFAWGFPMIVVAISLIIASTLEDGITSYTNQYFCWVSFSNGLVWSFVGPVLLVLLANLIILVRVVCEMTRLNRAKVDEADSIKRAVKACVVLFPLLGLTWLFGLLAVTDAGLVFQYIFTILNSFQGFFIFVLHCVRSGEIRGSFNRKLQLWELTRSSNFTSSKSAADNSMSMTSDKNSLRPQKFASTDSLQDSLSRNNRVNPANTDDNNSVRTCVTPIDRPQPYLNS